MTRFAMVVALLGAFSVRGRAARCTTVADAENLREYERYVARAELVMLPRFEGGELAWLPSEPAREISVRLAAGKAVRTNISDPALNQRLAARNGTIIHWVGGIRINGATLPQLRAVLEDYDAYNRIYSPMIFQCRAHRNGGRTPDYDAVLGLMSKFRFASVFPQRYSFLANAHIDHSEPPALNFHLRAREIRESDSGIPGRDDLLDQYHDHGIMWALNAYWRARARPDGVYLEFETITLARSVQAFVCKLGFIPVPKSVVASAMDSLPAESVETILEGTRAECERRFGKPRP